MAAPVLLLTAIVQAGREALKEMIVGLPWSGKFPRLSVKPGVGHLSHMERDYSIGGKVPRLSVCLGHLSHMETANSLGEKFTRLSKKPSLGHLSHITRAYNIG
jgi:hypothetical protein